MNEKSEDFTPESEEDDLNDVYAKDITSDFTDNLNVRLFAYSDDKIILLSKLEKQIGRSHIAFHE